MEYTSDEEQVERIKKWWSENGNAIIFGIVIGVGSIMGWRYWTAHQIEQSAQASVHFEMMMTAVENNEYAKAQQNAELINSDFSSTPYHRLALLTLAKIQFEGGDLASSGETLQSVIEQDSDDSVAYIARKRLADVYIDQKNYDQALDVLSIDYPSSYQAAFEERKGDIYRLQGKKEQAQSAYLLAKVSTPPAADSAFLQQKMDELGH